MKAHIELQDNYIQRLETQVNQKDNFIFSQSQKMLELLAQRPAGNPVQYAPRIEQEPRLEQIEEAKVMP